MSNFVPDWLDINRFLFIDIQKSQPLSLTKALVFAVSRREKVDVNLVIERIPRKILTVNFDVNFRLLLIVKGYPP